MKLMHTEEMECIKHIMFALTVVEFTYRKCTDKNALW